MWLGTRSFGRSRTGKVGAGFVRCREGDKCVGVLQANDALLKAEKELNGGLEGGTLVPHRGSEEAFTFGDLPILRDELCTFRHYDTLLADDT